MILKVMAQDPQTEIQKCFPDHDANKSRKADKKETNIKSPRK